MYGCSTRVRSCPAKIDEEKPGLWTYRELIGTQISISHPTTPLPPPPERNRIGVYRTTITKVTHEYHHNANRGVSEKVREEQLKLVRYVRGRGVSLLILLEGSIS